MNEMISMYYDMPAYIKDVSDISTIKKADVTLTEIECMFPELLGEANVFAKCFVADEMTEFNMGVIGADGHAIAHLFRKRYSKARIIWFPNIDRTEESYKGVMHGLILTAVSAQNLLDKDEILASWLHMLVDKGFVLFENNGSIERKALQNVLNTNNLSIFKFFEPNIIHAVYVKNSGMGDAKKNDIANKRIPRYKKVYCVCPALVKSGGPELMHQLVYHINRFGGYAEIAYINSDEAKGYANPEFAEYVVGHITDFEDIEDEEGNAVVVPEGWPKVCGSIKKADILFWWLSVDNFKVIAKNEEDLNRKISEVKSKADLHLVQSEYAKNYVQSLEIPDERIIYLSDYINDEYLKNSIEVNKEGRRDIVLYNPKKGKETVEGLISVAPDIMWTAIENMTSLQVGELMKTAKVYIDFGNHPGKDRIPREAAINGCIVITGKKGSAVFKEDVPIPERYKLDENSLSYIEITRVIRNCIDNYNDIVCEFEDYREYILGEKNRFVKDVKNLFFASD